MSPAKVKPFNSPALFNLFFDKQKTYEGLLEYSIPTISLVGDTLQSVAQACKTLTKLMVCHPRAKDFSQDIVMKDRFGSGGQHVYKFKRDEAKNMWAVMRRDKNISFVIQPFAKFDRGFSYRDCFAPTDIRMIYLKGKIVQSYIRMAKSGDFRCNEHQGGSLTYLTLKEIPQRLIDRSNLIAQKLNKQHSLYALDFIISNSGNIYLLEGNTGPGLDWNLALKKNEIEAKKLINWVVQDLTDRVGTKTV